MHTRKQYKQTNEAQQKTARKKCMHQELMNRTMMFFNEIYTHSFFSASKTSLCKIKNKKKKTINQAE